MNTTFTSFNKNSLKFIQTEDVTVIGVNNDVSILGAGKGSTTIPGISNGSFLRISMRGIVGATIANPSVVITIKLFLGGTSVANFLVPADYVNGLGYDITLLVSGRSGNNVHVYPTLYLQQYSETLAESFMRGFFQPNVITINAGTPVTFTATASIPTGVGVSITNQQTVIELLKI